MDGISKPNSLSLYLGQKITQIVLVVKTKSIVYIFINLFQILRKGRY